MLNSSIVFHGVDGLALGNRGMYLVVFQQQYSIDVISDYTMIFYCLDNQRNYTIDFTSL